MHILPSRGRPQRLQRFFDDGQPEQPGVVVLDEDQMGVYSTLRVPSNWRVMFVPSMQGFARKCNAGFKAVPNEPWYAFSGDDGIGRTPHWDTLLGGIAEQGYIAWPNDLYGGKCTEPFICGHFVRDLGWLCHPKLRHLYTDTLWGTIAERLGIGRYCADIVQENLHYTNGKVPRDQTTNERMCEGDHAAWKTIDLEPLIETIRRRCESFAR